MADGHTLAEIREYTYLQFMIFATITERREALRRTKFVTDIAASLSGLFSGEDGDNPLGTHLDELTAVYNEDPPDGKATKQSRRKHKRQ